MYTGVVRETKMEIPVYNRRVKTLRNPLCFPSLCIAITAIFGALVVTNATNAATITFEIESLNGTINPITLHHCSRYFHDRANCSDVSTVLCQAW